MKCKNINPEESRKAIKESQKSLKPSKKDESNTIGPFFVFPSASVTTRATYFIADMDFQKKHAADCLIKLKALRAEEKHGD
jgi:hypothetical protein